MEVFYQVSVCFFSLDDDRNFVLSWWMGLDWRYLLAGDVMMVWDWNVPEPIVGVSGTFQHMMLSFEGMQLVLVQDYCAIIITQLP